MYGVELYAAVRLAVVEEGLSHREAGRRFGIDRRTVKKMLSYSAPPGYRRSKPVRRPKLEGFTGIVDAILEADRAPDVPRKQRHTAYRIFERLRDEHGFTGGYTIVKDYVRSQRQSTREAFVPLYHPPRQRLHQFVTCRHAHRPQSGRPRCFRFGSISGEATIRSKNNIDDAMRSQVDCRSARRSPGRGEAMS